MNESANHVSVMTDVCVSDNESCDEEITFGQLASDYKDLYIKSEELSKIAENQKVIINQLKSEKTQLLAKTTDLEEEFNLLSTKLNNMTKSVKMLNTGTNMLDEILMVGKHAGDSTGIGYEHYQNEDSETKFVSAEKKSTMWTHHTPHQKPSHKGKFTGTMWAHSTPHHKSSHKGKFTSWKCHYCGKNGHLKPFCYKLYGYPKKIPQVKAQ
jgi:hypothetical protein